MKDAGTKGDDQHGRKNCKGTQRNVCLSDDYPDEKITGDYVGCVCRKQNREVKCIK